MQCREVEIGNVLTRAGGYLKPVVSHSLQPYRGCSLGRSLCGVGCYVQHGRHLLAGRSWGGFLDVRVNAAASYLAHVDRERRWARRARGRFAVFLSSATEPFPPQEGRYRVTQSILEAMCHQPPDELIVQTHSHRVADFVELLKRVAGLCRLRVHLSIETDRDRLRGLPAAASSVAARFGAAAIVRRAGIRMVVTVAPLLPIADPHAFFARVAQVADAVVIDHFIEGDGSPDGRRTRRTALPAAMAAVEPRSVELDYRREMAEIAERYLPGGVGVGSDGFAGRFRPPAAGRVDAGSGEHRSASGY